MTQKEAVEGMKRLWENMFTSQWEEARAMGFTEAQIAKIWNLRQFKPPPDWQPPPRTPDTRKP